MSGRDSRIRYALFADCERMDGRVQWITANTTPYDVEAIRRDFPILSREVYGKPLVYLDNGASAQKPKVVLDAIQHAYANEYANVHRGLHFLSNAATDAYEKAREIVRRFLNAPVGRRDRLHVELDRGDQHGRLRLRHAEYRRGRRDRALDHGASLQHRAVAFHPRAAGRQAGLGAGGRRGALPHRRLREAPDDRTKLVAITHMSNALGTVTPIKEICRIAHERGIPVLVDGSQAAVHMPIDVQDLDCDWFVMTGHKLYGPSGIGVLYGKKEMLEKMRPFQGGGEMIVEVTEGQRHLQRPAAPLRGRHAADRAGDRAGRGARLYGKRRARAHRRA
jgi:cysteine desulfurase/selenocysteine lyase